MFWHWIIGAIVTFGQKLYDLLPAWNLQVGSGYGDGATADSSLDNSFLHYLLLDLAPFDKFIPLHDGVLPLVTAAVLIFGGLLAFKGVKFLLSLIPGISAGG